MAENIDQDTIRWHDFIEEEPIDIEEEPIDIEEEPIDIEEEPIDIEEEPISDIEEEQEEVVFGEVSGDDFTERESFEDITTLKIESYVFSEERDKEILQGVFRALMAEDSRIRTLNFFCTKISDEDVQSLIAALKSNSTLTRLTFSFCNITESGWNLLEKALLEGSFHAELLIEGGPDPYGVVVIKPSSNITTAEWSKNLYLWSATTNKELERS